MSARPVLAGRTRSERRRARRAAFSLIEVMVALTIAAFVISTVYTLGGASARHFQQQQRVGQLQLGTRLALDRLRRDIERAGLHASPDSNLERLCGAGAARRVQAVQLFDNDAGSRAALNGYGGAASNTTTEADRLRLFGNFYTSDTYLVRSLNATGTAAFLQTNWQGFRRSFTDQAATTEATFVLDTQAVQDVFRIGRMIHISTLTGNHFFVTINNVTISSGTDVSIGFTPGLGIGGACVGGLGEGALIAPIGEIEYAIAAAAPEAMLAPRDVAVTGPNTALVRRELDGAGLVLAQRTVLEYAVHFDVDAVVDTSAGIGLPPVLAVVRDNAAQVSVTARPSRVRALQVEIGARTPDQEPTFPWVAPIAGAPLSRFRVFSDRRGAARVRTGRLEVSVPNLVSRGI